MLERSKTVGNSLVMMIGCLSFIDEQADSFEGRGRGRGRGRSRGGRGGGRGRGEGPLSPIVRSSSLLHIATADNTPER